MLQSTSEYEERNFDDIQRALDIEHTVKALESQLCYDQHSPEEVARQILKAACKFYDADWCGLIQVDLDLKIWTPFWWYKSFRKYLTAPPQEDVLAAAKELLSQQFQNLRVLNSQPPALTKHTKGDLHSIEQISERMLSTPTESSVEFMVAELDDALQSLMFRWNICYERYSSFHLSDNEKKKIGLIIQSGIDFLQKKKEVPL